MEAGVEGVVVEKLYNSRIASVFIKTCVIQVSRIVGYNPGQTQSPQLML